MFLTKFSQSLTTLSCSAHCLPVGRMYGYYDFGLANSQYDQMNEQEAWNFCAQALLISIQLIKLFFSLAEHMLTYSLVLCLRIHRFGPPAEWKILLGWHNLPLHYCWPIFTRMPPWLFGPVIGAPYSWNSEQDWGCHTCVEPERSKEAFPPEEE